MLNYLIYKDKEIVTKFSWGLGGKEVMVIGSWDNW